jgi:hypothetical protein
VATVKELVMFVCKFLVKHWTRQAKRNCGVEREISDFMVDILIYCGPGSSVGIASDYGLNGSGIEFRWARDFSHVQTGPGAHPASCTMDTGSFPGVKCGRGVLLTTHPLLVPRSWKSRAIPVPPSWPQPGL